MGECSIWPELIILLVSLLGRSGESRAVGVLDEVLRRENGQRQGKENEAAEKQSRPHGGLRPPADELHEQLGGRLPDVILYPTGGGTGLVGMWKAFEEMETLGWIGSERPRMVTVQATGCAPIVRAHERGDESAPVWEGAATYAAGLRVPAAVGDFLMLRTLRESRGYAVAIEDREMARSVAALGAATGIFACPEGGACLAAAEELVSRGDIGPDDEVVLFNTGSGFNYAGTEPLPN